MISYMIYFIITYIVNAKKEKKIKIIINKNNKENNKIISIINYHLMKLNPNDIESIQYYYKKNEFHTKIIMEDKNYLLDNFTLNITDNSIYTFYGNRNDIDSFLINLIKK